MLDSSHPDVSVIVPAYNEAAVISDCLAALVNQTYPDECYEVIVVDNDSSDGTVSVVRDYPVTAASETERQSSYAARNTGLDYASGEVLAFTDADVTVSRDWIESGVRILAETDGLAAVYGRTVPTVDRPLNIYEKYDILRSFDTDLYKTWNLFTTHSVFAEVGGFNQQLISAGDIEWAERAAASGVTIRRSDNVRASHPPRASWEALRRMSARQGYGAGQRMRLLYADPTLSLLVKEPARLLDWYSRVAEDIGSGTEWVDLSFVDRVGIALLAVPLGMVMAAGRLRGLFGTAADGRIGDYQ